jgi:hypothetical protein
MVENMAPAYGIALVEHQYGMGETDFLHCNIFFSQTGRIG